jgi:predicted transposase/invertase (TIGR01784 family)
MKTDSLFYELFKAHPASLFELAGIEPYGEYVFESITVKSTEKRMDGFFRSADGSGQNIFLEVQGYDDKIIYWRFLREISAYYEQTKSGQPFTAIVLFIDEKYDPKNCPVTDFNPPNRFISLYLPACLKIIGNKASPLTVFKPILLKKKRLLPEAVPKWKNEIDSLNLSESMNKVLIELLENAILSRFPKLTLEEIKKMIRLTPLDKTVAGQELIQMGIDEGVLRGLEKGRIEGIQKGRIEGELIGKIHIVQRLLKRPITPKKKLIAQSPKELRAMLKQLEAELKIA